MKLTPAKYGHAMMTIEKCPGFSIFIISTFRLQLSKFIRSVIIIIVIGSRRDSKAWWWTMQPSEQTWPEGFTVSCEGDNLSLLCIEIESGN